MLREFRNRVTAESNHYHNGPMLSEEEKGRQKNPFQVLALHDGSRILTTAHFRLARREWNVPILDHVHNLPFHGQTRQNDEVHHENWPKDWHIEDLEEGAEECDQC